MGLPTSGQSATFGFGGGIAIVWSRREVMISLEFFTMADIRNTEGTISIISRIPVMSELDSPFLPLSNLSSFRYNGNNVIARITPQRTGTRNGRMIITHQDNSTRTSISLMVRSIPFCSKSGSWIALIR
jgi:hypothetical protein